MRFDFGGNGWGPEAGLYALQVIVSKAFTQGSSVKVTCLRELLPVSSVNLQYYWATGNATAAAPYIPIATNALDFYASHYQNKSEDGTFMLWPSQVWFYR